MAASDNVTNLLDALCRSLYRDFSNRDGDMTADGIDTKFVRRCKTVAYEVLLKKAPAKLCDLEPDQSDPSKHLRYCQFECNLQMGLAKSLEFGNYGMFNANTGFSRRIREQNVLVEKTLAILNNSDGEDMTQQPIMLVLTNLINLACNRGGQQVIFERFSVDARNSLIVNTLSFSPIRHTNSNGLNGLHSNRRKVTLQHHASEVLRRK